MSGKHISILSCMFVLTACSGGGDSTGAGGSGGDGSGGAHSYVCRVGEPCDDTDIYCTYDPLNPETGLLECDGAKFFSTCDIGFYCNNDGSTPEFYPGCTSKKGVDLTCNLDLNALEPIDQGAGGAGGTGGTGTGGG